MTTLRIDISGIGDAARELEALGGNALERATAAALNKTADKARVEMRRSITDVFALRASDVNPRLKLRRASAKGLHLEATLEALPGSRRGISMNVIRFLVRKKRKARKSKGAQLGFRFHKGGAIKAIAGAFVGNKGRTVFRRVPGTVMASRSKYAGTQHAESIESVRVIDVPGMFNTRRINERVVAKIRIDFPIEFDRAARMLMAKASRA